jgi:hypothetical protein
MPKPDEDYDMVLRTNDPNDWVGFHCIQASD